MYGYIYLTINNINSKKYIGQHAAKQFSESYKGSGKALQKAFKKYGKVNFTTSILDTCESQEELDEKEIYYINLYDAVNSDEFYNLIPGGHGVGEESRLKMSLKKEHLSNHTKNTIWIYKDDEHIRVPKESLQEYLSLGYQVGGCKRSALAKERYSKSKKNLTIMTDDKVTIYVPNDDVEKYLSMGYRCGRIKQTEYSPVKNRIWIHLNDTSKMIYEDELETYLQKGYSQGRAPIKSYKKRNSSPTKGKKKIVLEDGTIKYI